MDGSVIIGELYNKHPTLNRAWLLPLLHIASMLDENDIVDQKKDSTIVDNLLPILLMSAQLYSSFQQSKDPSFNHNRYNT